MSEYKTSAQKAMGRKGRTYSRLAPAKSAPFYPPLFEAERTFYIPTYGIVSYRIDYNRKFHPNCRVLSLSD